MIRSLGSIPFATLSPVRFAIRCAGILRGWRERSTQRRHLRELDDATLRDLGLTRSDAMREGDKLFWRH